MIWNCREKKIEYGEKPLIMGIVNVTPDSFSDGGKYLDSDVAVAHAIELVNDGADILDFGAQSTRPGHTPITADEEISRLESVIKRVREQTNIPISVDTYFPKVAQKVLEWGADIINDVSGVVSPQMAKVVKEANAGWIIMHSSAGDIEEVKKFFVASAKECESFGLDKSQICFDMGIGFGKNREQDLRLISFISEYKLEGYPLLLGTSRKRVIGEYGGEKEPINRDFGNVSAHTVGILGGADIIRLHNVKDEMQGIKIAGAIRHIKNN